MRRWLQHPGRFGHLLASGHFARDTSPHANELKVVVVARRHECKPPRVSPTEIAIDLVSANAPARRDMKSRVLNFELTLPAGSDDLAYATGG